MNRYEITFSLQDGLKGETSEIIDARNRAEAVKTARNRASTISAASQCRASVKRIRRLSAPGQRLIHTAVGTVIVENGKAVTTGFPKRVYILPMKDMTNDEVKDFIRIIYENDQ